MNDSIYYKVVQESPLIFKLKEVTPKIYEVWKAHTQLQYLDYSFKADVKTLTTDLITAFAKSLECLCQEEKEDKRKIPGWSEGFVLGCACSMLITQWSYQYVYLKTAEYKELFFIKVLIQYLNFDLITLGRIEKLYHYFIDKKIDIASKEDNKPEVVIYLNKFIKEKQNTAHHEFKEKLITYLENILLEKHHLIFNQIIDKQYLPEMDNFISNEDIKFLIHQMEQQKDHILKVKQKRD